MLRRDRLLARLPSDPPRRRHWGCLSCHQTGRLLLSGLWGILLGCSGDTNGPAPLPASKLFWALQLNQHAVNLALTAPPGQPVVDTVQLVATALTAAETPLPSGGVTYRANDSTVTVDSTGLVTANFITIRAQVVASLTVDGVTHADTVIITVTDTPFPARLATFSIQPRPDGADSARYAIDGGNPILPVYATIATGDPATDTVCDVSSCALAIAYASSNPTVAEILQGAVVPHSVGHVTFFAKTLAYGVTKQDSLPFVIGYPIGIYNANEIDVVKYTSVGSSKPVLQFSPQQFIVGVGGTVFFTNRLTTPIDVVFDGSTDHLVFGLYGTDSLSKPVIYPLVTDSAGENQQAGVTIKVAGTYTYHSRLFGTRGTIVVSSGP